MSKPISEREKLLDLKPNQEFKNYKIVSKKPADGEELAIPIGEGGSGIVYLAEQTFVKQVKVNRAIKFLFIVTILPVKQYTNSQGELVLKTLTMKF